MSRERRKHFIRDWMIVRGFDLRSLAKKSNLAVKTVMRIRDGEAYYPRSFASLCEALAITTEEAYVNPYDLLQRKHLPREAPPEHAPPKPAIDLDRLPDLLVNDDGRPLNPLQKEALTSFIETIKKMRK